MGIFGGKKQAAQPPDRRRTMALLAAELQLTDASDRIDDDPRGYQAALARRTSAYRAATAAERDAASVAARRNGHT